jgi:N-methylhydantoinase A
MPYNIGVDIGGTFTDCVVVDDAGRIAIGKALSTPPDFAVGTGNAVRDAANRLGLTGERELLSNTRLFFHACTVGDNTLLTRSGPTTGLVTTGGFGDTALMMRGKITEGMTETEAAHFSALVKPEPVVPRPLIGEVIERIDYKGAVVLPLDKAQAERVVDELVGRGARSIAICLLWSIANDAHERTIAELITGKHPGIFVSRSADVAPFLGEYERTITTVFNAYIGPEILRYLRNLSHLLGEAGLRREPLIMQAYGGVLDIHATAQNATGVIESGPAAGVVGSKFFGELTGHRDVLVTDMGGTTFKVSVIRDGSIERNFNPVILRHNIVATKIWVESIGAGGGSIAWVDPDTNLLKVGPQGAGSKPGPVCYGLGGVEPTVTDADVVLGYLNPDYFLGGRMRLDKQAAFKAIEERIANSLGISVIEAATGIYRITNAHMADIARRATLERGYDPRGFAIFAIGGASAAHAARYAAELGVREVVVPPTASVHAALGLTSSDVVFESGVSDRALFPPGLGRLNANFGRLIARATADLRAMEFDPADITIQRSLDLRYRFQCHELNVAFPPGAADLAAVDLERFDTRFDEVYEQHFGPGSGYREAGKEIVTFRVTATGRIRKPALHKQPRGPASAAPAKKGERLVFFEAIGDFTPTAIYAFERMTPGMILRGPAVIESDVTTIVVGPGDTAMVDEFYSVRLTLGAKEPR